MLRIIFYLTAICGLIPFALNAEELAPIQVIDEQVQVLTSKNADAAQTDLNQIPGGTTVIDEQKIRLADSRNLEGVLLGAPGVFVRSRFGGDEVRFSIRGAGINQAFNSRGVRFLRDGLPITDAEGIVRSQLIESLNVNHIEIYRGANALNYGAATLGGAINFVSPTAYTDARYYSRIEVGADNFLRFQTSRGWLLEEGVDVYASLSGNEQNGFRENSEQETIRFYANAGKRWNESSESRLHINWQDSNLELPGSLTESEAENNPGQTNPGSLLRNSQRDLNFYRAALQHTKVLENGGQLDIGLSYQYQEMFLPLAFALLVGNRNDVSLNLRATQELNSHNLTYGGLLTWGDNDGRQFRYLEDSQSRGSLSRRDEDQAWGVELFAQDTIRLTKHSDLILGAQLAYAEREIEEIPVSDAGLVGAAVNATEGYLGLSPRVGFVSQFNDHVQLFGNISKSFEPPTTFDLVQDFANGETETLDEQTAWSFELGSRGKINDLLNYEAAIYYSRIDNEILLQEDPSLPSGSGEFAMLNADETEHSGIELGINGQLTNSLQLIFAYTFNDFSFRDDDVFGNNRLPGIPKHQLQAELTYRNQYGFYFGPTFEYQSDSYVDFANTADVETYSIWGLKGGYEFDENVRIYFHAENLQDEEYVSNAAVAGLADSNSRLFNPGQDRSLFIGLEVKL